MIYLYLMIWIVCSYFSNVLTYKELKEIPFILFIMNILSGPISLFCVLIALPSSHNLLSKVIWYPLFKKGK